MTGQSILLWIRPPFFWKGLCAGFCWSCITQALESSDCCPVCRKRQLLEDGDLEVDVWLAEFVEQHLPPGMALGENSSTAQSADLDAVSAKKKVTVSLSGKHSSYNQLPELWDIWSWNCWFLIFAFFAVLIPSGEFIFYCSVDGFPTAAFPFPPTKSKKALVICVSGFRMDVMSFGDLGNIQGQACFHTVPQ